VSLKTAPLKKLIRLFYAPPRLRTSELRSDIRKDLSREEGRAGDGGDFHGPFWADARRHMLGVADLDELVRQRVADSKGRLRLYPLLAEGFLSWWNEKRRWRNEPLTLLPNPPDSRVLLPEVGGIAKVGGAIGLESGSGFHRIIYPYFAEEPALPAEGARLTIWAMSQALSHYQLDDLRVLDVLRGGSFGTLDFPLQGNERAIFVDRYGRLLAEWDQLRKQY